MRALAGAGGRKYRNVGFAEERFFVDCLLHEVDVLLSFGAARPPIERQSREWTRGLHVYPVRTDGGVVEH